MSTVYVSIGNSDNKLTQAEWAEFGRDFRRSIRRYASEVYGEWHSSPTSAFQNACIAFAVPVGKVEALRGELTEMREYYQQDSIAWAEAPRTEFI
jgi:hypothetical protein